MDTAKLIFFPGALGDFVCFLPTLLPLVAGTEASLLVARGELLPLVDAPGLRKLSIDRPEVSDLFTEGEPLREDTRRLFTGFADCQSWTGSASPQFGKRLRELVPSVAVHPFRDFAVGEHAIDYFARCAAVCPATTGTVTAALVGDEAAAVKLVAGAPVSGRPFLALHSGSGSKRKNWRGFRDLSREWRASRPDTAIVAISGPAEEECGVDEVEADVVARDLSLPQLVSLLRRAALYVGNDSGVSHLAAAVGAAGISLFGPSEVAHWSPRGDWFGVIQAGALCAECGAEVFCTHRLPVAEVLREILPPES